jgi:tetratricopeptide (TPR) repeat protein
LTVLLALALITLLGSDRVPARLATVWQGNAFRDGRLPLWAHTWPLATEFPVWGTGYGTFQYVERLHRTDPAAEELIYTNAENEYLEALVEGGVVRLAVSLLAIGLVYRLGLRAARALRGSPGAALALGALFAFTTLVVHSFGDFGLHIPAITVMATVIAAQLCTLSAWPAEGSRTRAREPFAGTAETVARIPGSRPPFGALPDILPVVDAAVALLLSVLLCAEGWKACRVQWLRNDHLNRARQALSENQSLASLEAAARLAPQSATLQVEIALWHYDRFRNEMREAKKKGRLTQVTQAVSAVGLMSLPASLPAPSLLASAPAWISAVEPPSQHSTDEEAMIRRRLVPALRHFLQARDLCPLLPEPHQCLADQRDRLQRADSRLAYLERTTLLISNNAGLWYLCGNEALGQDPERAWRSWRRSLELSDDYFPPILTKSGPHLGPAAMVERLLPDKPALLVDAAFRLYPQQPANRRPFLEKALGLSKQQPGPWSAEDLHLRAKVHAGLGQAPEALALYRAALAIKPLQTSWRFEFAQLLYENGQHQDGRQELQLILAHQPDHAPARDLLNAVDKKR